MFKLVLQRWRHSTRRLAWAQAATVRDTVAWPSSARSPFWAPARRRPVSGDEPVGLRERAGHWIDVTGPGLLAAARKSLSSRVMGSTAQLSAVRREFAGSLSDIRNRQADTTLARIQLARSTQELWHLRPELFDLVACHHDQAEADRRITRLNRHFPTRAPRSGFGALAATVPRDQAP